MNNYIKNFFNFSDEKISQLKATSFCGVLNFDLNAYEYDSNIEIIKVSDLVGSVRYDLDKVNNLYEAYEQLHKGYLYINTSIEKWKTILEKPEYNDFPEVVELMNKYYHFSDGKHRLITAKILGFKEIKVIVKRIKPNK